VDPTWIALAALLVVALAGGGWAWASRRPRIGADEAEAVAATDDAPGARRWFLEGLGRSRDALARGLARALGRGDDVEGALEELEDSLVAADLGVQTAGAIGLALRPLLAAGAPAAEVRRALRAELRARMGAAAPLAGKPDERPLVILVVGVNGSGKTTTIGKLAARYRAEGRSVLLAAGDTFRAGAIEQLRVWGERAGAPVVAHQEGADPAAVVHDAVQAAVARGIDVVICDTAGRLQAQKPLMDELGKVVRVMRKALPAAPDEVLLVLDATIGQNALAQARVFKEVVGVTGVVLTKLDGTAKGGVVVAVADQLGLPVKLVGLGEKVDDLRDFDPDAFVDALVGEPDATAREGGAA
jgi:fused signal recognition particle receptor